MSNVVRVGVAVIIMRQNTILLGERIGRMVQIHGQRLVDI